MFDGITQRPAHIGVLSCVTIYYGTVPEGRGIWYQLVSKEQVQSNTISCGWGRVDVRVWEGLWGGCGKGCGEGVGRVVGRVWGGCGKGALPSFG